MTTKKNSKLYAYDKDTGISAALSEMFVVKMLAGEIIENVGIYKKIEEAEIILIKYLKKGDCCWITSNNE
jgi:hypothetical protein